MHYLQGIFSIILFPLAIQKCNSVMQIGYFPLVWEKRVCKVKRKLFPSARYLCSAYTQERSKIIFCEYMRRI